MFDHQRTISRDCSFFMRKYILKERGGRMDYIIGMDIGTTASKGVLYQENGKKIAESQFRIP